jgi:hypothetical protein
MRETIERQMHEKEMQEYNLYREKMIKDTESLFDAEEKKRKE